MGFNAKKHVKVLDYDFRPHNDAHGVSPEPSTEMFRAFQFRIREIFDLEDDETNLVVAIARVDPATVRERDHDSAEAVAELVGGSPSLEEILELPYRIREAYVASVMEDMSDPRGGSSSTRS